MMDKTNIDEVEVVDSYIDGELSEKERREVELRAESDPEFSKELEWNRRLHEMLSSLRTEVPEDFSKRLQEALRANPAWDEVIASKANAPKAARGTRLGERKSASFKLPAMVTAGSVVVVAGLAIGGYRQLHQAPVAPVDAPIVAETPVLAPGIVDVSEGSPTIMTPSPEGNAPESVSGRLSQSQLWTVVKLGEEEQFELLLHEFERLCSRLEIRFTKFGGDREFILERVRPEQWREISAWFAGAATSHEASQALLSWSDPVEENSKAKNVRVTFGVASSESAELLEE